MQKMTIKLQNEFGPAYIFEIEGISMTIPNLGPKEIQVNTEPTDRFSLQFVGTGIANPLPLVLHDDGSITQGVQPIVDPWTVMVNEDITSQYKYLFQISHSDATLSFGINVTQPAGPSEGVIVVVGTVEINDAQ